MDNNLTAYESNVLIEALDQWCRDGDDMLDEKKAKIVDRIYDKLKALVTDANTAEDRVNQRMRELASALSDIMKV